MQIKYIYHPTRSDKLHSLNREDVEVVLQRLPTELWDKLRAVHFSDKSWGWGKRMLGYVTYGRSEISIIAIPRRISLTPWLSRNETPIQFGAVRGCQWPPVAVRRFMMYKVLLHEIGHLQLIDAKRKSAKLRFAKERLAQEFCEYWRHKFCAEHFEHPDPAHNPPSQEEITAVTNDWPKAHAEYKKALRYETEDRDELAAEHYKNAIETYPEHSFALEALGVLYYCGSGVEESCHKAIDCFRKAVRIDPVLPEANLYLGLSLSEIDEKEQADYYFKRAIPLYPRTAVALTDYANFLAEERESEGAELFFKRAVRKRKAYKETYISYGRYLINIKRDDHVRNLKKAVKLLDKAIDIDPESADTHYLLGYALAHLGTRLKEAMVHLQEALRLEPNHQEAKMALVRLKQNLSGRGGS